MLSGNDLARVLRWGAGYSGEDPYNILISVDEAEEVHVDRWTILLDAQEMAEDGKENGFLEPPKVHLWLICDEIHSMFLATAPFMLA